MGKRLLADIEAVYRHQTPSALAVSRDEDDKEWRWLPKSQIEYEHSGNVVKITLPVSLAEEKGLV